MDHTSYRSIFVLWSTLVCLLGASACEYREQKSPPISEHAWKVLRSIRVENAARDAENAHQVGKCFLFSAGDITYVGDRVSPEMLKMMNSYGTQEIEGTGDIFYGGEYDTLNSRAVEYMRIFNSTFIKLGPCIQKSSEKKKVFTEQSIHGKRGPDRIIRRHDIH